MTFFDSVVHNGYYFWTSRYLQAIGLPENWIAPAMSIGQVMEVVAMAWLGTLLKALGWRRTMILGVLSQAVRFGVYAIGSRELLPAVIAVNLVHGFAYACFFATVYIYVDESFPKDVRASAQSLFNLMILGISMLVSNFLWGGLGDVFAATSTVGGPSSRSSTITGSSSCRSVFRLVAAALLALFFHPPAARETSEEAVDEPLAVAQ